MNARRDVAAQYYMPDAHDQYTVQAAYTAANTFNNAAIDVVGLVANDLFGVAAPGNPNKNIISPVVLDPTTTSKAIAFNTSPSADAPNGVWKSTNPNPIAGTEASSYWFSFFQNDPNYNTSILRAWNFGIDAEGYIAGGVFESTIAPTLKQTQVGAGFEWNQHLSDGDTGWFLNASTAVQWVQNDWQWNENVVTAQSDLTGTDLNGYTFADGGFPSGDARPENLTQAFAQAAWKYGKVDGKRHVTRLSDIEVRFGYEFACEDTHHVQGYVGAIFPTGNKMKGEYLAEPVVGNGGHFGVMFGGTTEVQFTSDSDWKTSARWDYNWRWLFQNKQTRSIDLKENQWSRYMYVWPSWDAFNTAQQSSDAYYAFTPGINVFTQEVKVSPRQQFRVNTALVFAGENFRGELGLNMMARQSEKIELSNAWAETVVLAGTVEGYNTELTAISLNRTIYNDNIANQVATHNGSSSYTSTGSLPTAATPAVLAYTDVPQTLDETDYNSAVITADRLDLASAASPTALTGAPYLALGYAWEGDKVPGFMGIGGSYEYSFENRFINSWQLWAKLGFSF
ncbi:hypothetical protein EBQ93_04455 [bacterium]|nr:hypothetical protein [bacterium]